MTVESSKIGRTMRPSFKRHFFGLFLLSVIYITCFILTKILTLEDNTNIKTCDAFESESSNVFKIPLRKNKTTDFQPEVTGEDMYVYSAYYEGLDKIRLIGLLLKKTDPLLCLLHYWNSTEGTDTVRVVKSFAATIHVPSENQYASVYFLCYLCQYDLPDAVSITTDVNKISNVVPVQIIPRTDNPPIQFTMCGSPLYGTINELVFVEWIELHRILGVQKFILYDNGINNEIRNISNYYTTIGLIELHPWVLHDLVDKLRYKAQMAALNDCLYKTKGRSEYIAWNDVDEFIIPQRAEDYTWKDMIQTLPNDSGMFMFRNTFFHLYPVHQKNNIPPPGRLVTEMGRFREDFVFAPEERSKLIGRPNFMVTLDVHELNAIRKGHIHVVDIDVGMLHHYRPYLYDSQKSIIKNTRTEKYTVSLKDRVGNLSKLLNVFYLPNG